MRGVIRRPFARMRRRGSSEDPEHGAVAALVAVLLAGGVLLGMGALVIDVGQLYVEREQLQTGADAASFEIALNCAKGTVNTAPCNSATQTPIAVAYAKKNANDGQANAQICFNNTSCPSWGTGATCPALPTPAAGNTNGDYVEVRTTTLNTDGSTLVPPSFAGALSGSTYTGKKVGACARVNWGTPVTGRVFALGISLCDWKRMTGDNMIYYGAVGSLLNDIGLFPLLGLTNPTAGQDSAIPVAASLSVAGLPIPSCTTPASTPVANLSVPRGYAWLSNEGYTAPDSDCMINVDVGDSPRSAPALGFPITACLNKLTGLRTARAPALVPIFDAIAPELLSLAPAYHIVGFAPFVFTGFNGLLGGLLNGVGSLLSGSLLSAPATVLCGTSNCIYGYFTKTLSLAPRPVFGTGKYLGATVIGRTG
ncbi:Tad domain-containing protein [Micromonosporaceae bacterium Da 78-11]